MKSYMEDCEVMEVFSEHELAFHEEFCYISSFIRNNMILSLPQKEMDISEILEENIERELKNMTNILKNIMVKIKNFINILKRSGIYC